MRSSISVAFFVRVKTYLDRNVGALLLRYVEALLNLDKDDDDDDDCSSNDDSDRNNLTLTGKFMAALFWDLIKDDE